MTDTTVINNQIKDLIDQSYSDAEKIGKLAVHYVKEFFPSYLLQQEDFAKLDKEDSVKLMSEFTFFRICEFSLYLANTRFSRCVTYDFVIMTYILVCPTF